MLPRSWSQPIPLTNCNGGSSHLLLICQCSAFFSSGRQYPDRPGSLHHSSYLVGHLVCTFCAYLHSSVTHHQRSGPNRDFCLSLVRRSDADSQPFGSCDGDRRRHGCARHDAFQGTWSTPLSSSVLDPPLPKHSHDATFQQSHERQAFH